MVPLVFSRFFLSANNQNHSYQFLSITRIVCTYNWSYGLTGKGYGFCDDNSQALILKSVKMWKKRIKITQNCVTSYQANKGVWNYKKVQLKFFADVKDKECQEVLKDVPDKACTTTLEEKCTDVDQTVYETTLKEECTDIETQVHIR